MLLMLLLLLTGVQHGGRARTKRYHDDFLRSTSMPMMVLR